MATNMAASPNFSSLIDKVGVDTLFLLQIYISDTLTY